MNNLPEIKDIHLPDSVSFFPLAYGWWVILVLLILTAILSKIILKFIRHSKKRYALKELELIDTSSMILATRKMSELLKRICNIKYKKASVLYGAEWIDFLMAHSSIELSKEERDLLMNAPFIDKNKQSYKNVSIEKLKNFCKQWIGDNL